VNKQQIEATFRWRQTLVDNIEKIMGATKKSKKLDLSKTGQLDLFSMGLEDCKSNPKLNEYTGNIDLMEWVNIETDLLGVPITYEPLEDKWMYKELYCTHEVTDLFELTDDTKDIIVLDRITNIERRVSQSGNNYVKIHLSQLGTENYCYLWGRYYKEYIPKVFNQETYIFLIEYKKATPEFSKDSLIINGLKNIKDIEINEEYDRLIKSMNIDDELNESWQIKNKKQ
jgi:DNA polymerase III alpha subunit